MTDGYPAEVKWWRADSWAPASAPRWAPVLDIALGTAVALIGVVAANFDFVQALIAIGMGVATGLFRLAPGIALGMAWGSSLVLILSMASIPLVMLAMAFVAYGCSRYGSRRVLLIAAVSVVLGAIITISYVMIVGPWVAWRFGLNDFISLIAMTATLSLATRAAGYAVGFLIVLALLAAPWGTGLVVRLRENSRQIESARAQARVEVERAQDVAGIESERARLARDVHDVVGHSLTVIVAQADSTRFIPDDEIDQIRAAIENIAASARRSLADVRQVLSAELTDTGSYLRITRDLTELVDGVRAAGNEVAFRTRGVARPLPPELEAVAYRTLQEMLTNALKHGMPGRPIDITLEWSDGALHIGTVNVGASLAPGPEGRGLRGMRERLAAVGGAQVIELGDNSLFTVVARVPLRVEST